MAFAESDTPPFGDQRRTLHGMTSGTSTSSIGAASTALPPLQPFASASAVTPPPGVPPSNASSRTQAVRWRSLEGLTTALTVLLVVAAATAAFGVAALIRQVRVLGGMDGRFVGFDRIDRVHDAVDLVTAAAITCALVALVIAVLFIVWMWRAAKNNEALGRDNPRLGSGWAIGGWFIPLANLVIPVLVLQDLWRGSAAQIPRGDMRWRITDRSALVGWWWAALVVSIPRLSSGGDGTSTSELDDLRTHAAIVLVCMLAGLAAAGLAILVVRRLAARQAACLATQQAAWAQAVGDGPVGDPAH